MTATIPAPTSPWSPLRVTVFRNLWLAALVSNIGTTMHTVGAAWAMTDLSDSPTVVSLVQTAWAVPGFLVAIPAGAFADVVDRRKLILVSQLGSLFFAAVLGVLAVTDRLEVPSLLVGTFVLSIVMTMSGPAFMALIPELVEPRELTQAIGLNNIAYNGSQSVGPALAGVIIAVAGPGAVFLINAASFLGIVIVMWRFRPERPGPTSDEPMWHAMKTGVTYFAGRRILSRYAIRIALAFLATSSMVALLPVVARQQLDATSAQFGIMSAAFGVGAVVAVWALPPLKLRFGPDTLVFGAASLWSTGAVMVALTGWVPVATVGVLFTGIGTMAAMNIVYSMFMLMLPNWIRGRASSVVMLTVWLGTSIGTVVWGAVADAAGIRNALLVAAAVHLTATATVCTRFTLTKGYVTVDEASRPAD
ncbi:MAG: hypothetical protein RL238_3386 [Actinomycetota bacterium]